MSLTRSEFRQSIVEWLGASVDETCAHEEALQKWPQDHQPGIVEVELIERGRQGELRATVDHAHAPSGDLPRHDVTLAAPLAGQGISDRTLGRGSRVLGGERVDDTGRADVVHEVVGLLPGARTAACGRGLLGRSCGRLDLAAGDGGGNLHSCHRRPFRAAHLARRN